MPRLSEMIGGSSGMNLITKGATKVAKKEVGASAAVGKASLQGAHRKPATNEDLLAATVMDELEARGLLEAKGKGDKGKKSKFGKDMEKEKEDDEDDEDEEKNESLRDLVLQALIEKEDSDEKKTDKSRARRAALAGGIAAGALSVPRANKNIARLLKDKKVRKQVSRISSGAQSMGMSSKNANRLAKGTLKAGKYAGIGVHAIGGAAAAYGGYRAAGALKRKLAARKAAKKAEK